MGSSRIQIRAALVLSLSSFYYTVTGTNKTISSIVALVANSAWSVVIYCTGERLWYGPNIGSDLSGYAYG